MSYIKMVVSPGPLKEGTEGTNGKQEGMKKERKGGRRDEGKGRREE
jgi:hypothetical protein